MGFALAGCISLPRRGRGEAAEDWDFDSQIVDSRGRGLAFDNQQSTIMNRHSTVFMCNAPLGATTAMTMSGNVTKTVFVVCPLRESAAIPMFPFFLV